VESHSPPVPKKDNTSSHEEIKLEPAFMIYIENSEVRMSFISSSGRETRRSIMFVQNTEESGDVGILLVESEKNALLSVPVLRIEDSLLNSQELVVFLADDSIENLSDPLSTVLVVGVSRNQVE
jgi:hypothetical protein